jgi:hypothetical protein
MGGTEMLIGGKYADFRAGPHPLYYKSINTINTQIHSAKEEVGLPWN